MKKHKQHNDQLWNRLNSIIEREFFPLNDASTMFNEIHIDTIKYRTSNELDYLYMRVSNEIKYHIIEICSDET